MITIDQLLESVDLDFEPRFITKSKTGHIGIWREKPEVRDIYWIGEGIFTVFGKLRISEFSDKDWTECIYEVPRKVDPYAEPRKWIGKLCRFWSYGFSEYYAELEQVSAKRRDKPFFAVGGTYWYEYCEPVRPDDDVIYKDAVNELKGAKNENI